MKQLLKLSKSPSQTFDGFFRPMRKQFHAVGYGCKLIATVSANSVPKRFKRFSEEAACSAGTRS